MNDTLISIENVTVAFEGITALEDVNMEIKRNDFIGIIGPNGGGKTTLVKVILGFNCKPVPKTSGYRGAFVIIGEAH